MMMMVLVSKQHKVTNKYKMQATLHFSLICQSGEDIIIQKCRASGFSSHLPCRTSSCGNYFWGLWGQFYLPTTCNFSMYMSTLHI